MSTSRRSHARNVRFYVLILSVAFMLILSDREHSARQPHAQPRRPLSPHSGTGPARQGTHPAHPGRHIRSYAIRQQRSYADNWASQHPHVTGTVLDQATAQARSAQTFGRLLDDGA